jgi:3-phenylpropionate/cinnamic acid dioxygenase small subunit
MSAEEDIRRTLARYCQLCDDGRFDEWAELYTDDARFLVMGRVYEGPAAIKGFIEMGQPPERRGKHMCANSIIDVAADGASASAVTDYVFVGRNEADEAAIMSVGRYHDELVPGDAGWQFRRREIVFLGEQPSGA